MATCYACYAKRLSKKNCTKNVREKEHLAKSTMAKTGLPMVPFLYFCLCLRPASVGLKSSNMLR